MAVAVQSKKKAGRPKLIIDEKLVKDLAMIHCTKDEIASIVGCSRETLYDRFSHILLAGSEMGKMSLRRAQWKLAEKGNAQMLIWLGKQWLGQKDRSPEEVGNTFIQVSVQAVP